MGTQEPLNLPNRPETSHASFRRIEENNPWQNQLVAGLEFFVLDYCYPIGFTYPQILRAALMSIVITTQLEYLVPMADKPVYFASEGGAEAQLTISAQFTPRSVTIADARELKPGPTLDQDGFTLIAHNSAVTDFYDDAQIKDIYQFEAAQLVQQSLGATDAIVFDNTRRSDASTIRGEHNLREPSTVIHNDYTDASARQRLSDILGDDEASIRSQRRFSIINVWRSIGGPVVTTPLAVCTAASLREEDLVASERRAKDRIGELQLVTYNPEHRWYWYSSMARHEALLIKTFDSSLDGRARRAIHTAFTHPKAPVNAQARESIETRVLAFFD
ncbi:MAG: hypothetical protein ACJAYC_001561 [Halieaceae bacterium]